MIEHMFATLVDRFSGSDDASLTERLRELELESRRLDAERAALVAEAKRRVLYTVDGHRNVKAWLRAHCNHSSARAARTAGLGALIDASPGVGEALHRGAIGLDQAELLAKAHANQRCGHLLPESIDLLLDCAARLEYDDFRVVVRRWELLADADGAHRHAERSHERRTASVNEIDGSVDVRASGGRPLVAAELIEIFNRFIEHEFRADVAARTAEHGPDAPASMLPRTDAQRRFDALASIFRKAASTPADARPPEPVVNIICDQLTFEQILARHRLIDPPSDLEDLGPTLRRCETDTGIPVPGDDVLRAALTGHIRRIVFDRNGVITNVGRRRRLFAGVARIAARLSALNCGWLACTVGANRAEIDHLYGWDDGGETDLENADVECSSHNRLKSRGYRARRDRYGTTIIHRPDGTPMQPVGAPPPQFPTEPPPYEPYVPGPGEPRPRLP
jgi:hypothetical protein